jgi:uncharacterized membrane protein YozB (DUF420 family)
MKKSKKSTKIKKLAPTKEVKKIDPCCEPHNILRSIRIFASVIVLTIVLADVLNAWAESWPVMIIMLMALYILVWSYQSYFQKYRLIMLIISVILAALLVTGVVTLLLLNNYSC